MGLLSDLINKTTKDQAPPKDNWVNDYPNGFIFLVIMMLVLFISAFVLPLF
jgi:hypothetical protein